MSTRYLILDEEKLSSDLRYNKKISFEQLVSNYLDDGWIPLGGGMRINGLGGFGYRTWNWVHLYK